MQACLLLAVLCVAGTAGQFVPPPVPHPGHPVPLPVPPPPPPHKQFSGSVCPVDSTCVRPEDCSRQCRPGWDSLDLSSCYLIAPDTALIGRDAAEAECGALGAHLPVLETPEELARLARFGPHWTDARWDAGRAAWLWAVTGQPVDFEALGAANPGDGSAAEGCLMAAREATDAPLKRAACDLEAFYLCETGSSSVARCMRNKGRLCCAVSADHYTEPCYVDAEGTRCEQRIREGYFPLGEGLVLPTEGTDAEKLPWAQARDQCQRDGGDLLTVDSKRMNQAIVDMLKGLEVLGGVQYYIGLSSDADGIFRYVNGTRLGRDSFQTFASAEDAARPRSCVYYESGAWRSGDCGEPRDFICHVRRVRHSLRRAPAAPRCGRRQNQGVLGKSGFPAPPPLPLPALLPPLGPHDDGRRGAAQFGEFPWQAAIWTRAERDDHQFSCSGALVAAAWVLAAADCVSGADPADLKVTVGDWSLDETQPVNLPPVALDVTRVELSRGHLSPGPFGPVREPGRFAMLRITPDLDGHEYPHVAPVCLPEPSLLQHVHQLRCVVTGWRGGVPQFPHHLRPGAEPDQRDILRKFETGIRHDPDCQDIAQHLKSLHQRPPFPFPAPFRGPFPVPFSAAPEVDLEGRSPLAFGPPPFLSSRPPLAPPPRPEQPALYVCPRDLRCIPDRGALLACALPPPPPPFRGPPPLFHPLFRSAQNDTAEKPAAVAASPAAAASPSPAASPAGSSAAPAAAAPAQSGNKGTAAAYEELKKSFRPPVQPARQEPRARRDTSAAAASPAAADSSDAAATGRSGFNLPHVGLAGLINTPTPHAPPEPFHEPFHQPPPPPPESTEYYEAYTIVGIASPLTRECSVGQMIFDDVIQEVEFVQQVLHRDGQRAGEV